MFINKFLFVRRFSLLVIFLILFAVIGLDTLTVSASSVSPSKVIDNANDLKSYLVDQLNQQESTIEVDYTVKYDGDADSFIKSIEDCLEAAQVSLKDDKRWNIYSVDMNVSGYLGDAHIGIDIEYLSTKEELSYVDAQVNEILSGIIKSDMSEIQKEKTIHDFIIKNTQYSDEGLQSHTAYYALSKGKAVCQGYALLAYKLLDKAGFETRLVDGYMDNDPNQAHIWNAVKLNGSWLMLDITRDDSNSNSSVISTKYFNRSAEEFLKEGYSFNFATFK